MIAAAEVRWLPKPDKIESGIRKVSVDLTGLSLCYNMA